MANTDDGKMLARYTNEKSSTHLFVRLCYRG